VNGKRVETYLEENTNGVSFARFVNSFSATRHEGENGPTIIATNSISNQSQATLKRRLFPALVGTNGQEAV